MIIGVVKVTLSATLESKGKSDGHVTCALALIGLVIDSSSNTGKVVLKEETNVVTKVVVEGFTVGTSCHIEDLTALSDTAMDLVSRTPDVLSITL